MILNIIPLRFSNESLLKKIIMRLSVLFDDIRISHTLIDIEKSYSEQRKQYHSTVLLESFIKSGYSSEGYILILTEMDLFVPVLTHVFGEAQLNGKLSIVSVCRLYEEFYTAESDPKLLADRCYKEILHELGHNFGLVHCKDWECVMHVSNSVEEIDIKGNYYCTSCQKKMKIK